MGYEELSAVSHACQEHQVDTALRRTIISSMNETLPSRQNGAYGVVSLLDDASRAAIEKIWHELENGFKIPHRYEQPIAHFSYHVAESYDHEKIEPLLDQFARYKQAFKVRTDGLGFFNSSRPVIHIPIVRNPQLTTFQRSLWELVKPWSKNALQYYDPDCWMPHITLVHGNIEREQIAQVLGFLVSYELCWEINIANISVISAASSEVNPELQFKLTGA